MSPSQPDIEAPGDPTTKVSSNSPSRLGWLCAFGLSLSLVVPEGFSIVPLILMACGIWSLVRGCWHRADTNPAMIGLLICFAVYAAGSAALSAAHGDPPGHFEQYLPFLGATLIAVALQTCPLNPNQLIGGFAVAAVMAGIASIVQVVQAEGAHRAYLFTTMTTFGMLGALYAIVCASALGWPCNQGAKRWRVLLVCGAMGGLTIALLSGSKGSWLPLLMVGPVAFALATRKLGAWSRLKWAAAVLSYVWLINFVPHNPIVLRAQSFSQHGDSFRVAYWKEAVEMIKTSPLIGVGRREVSRRLVNLTAREYGSPLPSKATRDLHNEYLDIFAARGVMGLILVLMTLGVPLVLLVRRARDPDNSNRDLAVTGILFVVAFAICGLTDVQFQSNAKRMTYVLGVVVFVHFASRKPCRNQ